VFVWQWGWVRHLAEKALKKIMKKKRVGG